jgi:hypothetical protein
LDERERVSVLARDGVEFAIVDTDTEGTILLLDEEDGGRGRRGGWAKETLGEHVLEVSVQCFELAGRAHVDWTELGSVTREDVDGVVIGRVLGETRGLGL